MNAESLQRSFFQQITVSDFLDVKYSQNEWKMAKIINYDKRYVVIKFDGYSYQEEQIYISSSRIAPLRAYTEGYTGPIYRQNQLVMMFVDSLQAHLDTMNSLYSKECEFTPFKITQYLRGQLFVLMHTLFTTNLNIKKQQSPKIMQFLNGFIHFVMTICQKVKENISNYFTTNISNNRFIYLTNSKIAMLYSLQQLLILLNYIIGIDIPKTITLFKNYRTQISQQQLLNYLKNIKNGLSCIIDLYSLNDNGKWLPTSIRLSIYKIIIKLNLTIKIPQYKIKDFQEVFQLYPKIIQTISTSQKQYQYLNYMSTLLAQQSPFQAKLKAIQEGKRILQGECKLSHRQPEQFINLLNQKNAVQYMLNDCNFNAQIFKRFFPILKPYWKAKSFNKKHIQSLFKLASVRHESQMQNIYDIICGIAQFAPVDFLDQIYSEISVIDINSLQILKLIRNFTIKALINFSKQKSGFGAFFGRKKISSKYGYYGLVLLWKQMQDDGKIKKEHINTAIQMFKDIFNEQLFQSQRWTYLTNCAIFLQKKKNFGQSLKNIINIINSYPQMTIFSEDRKNMINKLDSKFHLIGITIRILKNTSNINFLKIEYKQCLKYFYQFLQQHNDNLKYSITVDDINYLWQIQGCQMLFNFLRRCSLENVSNNYRKYHKNISHEKIKQLFNNVLNKKTFYNRQLSYQQFECIHQLFLTYQNGQKNIEISQPGIIRYLNNNNLLGYDCYYYFIEKCTNNKILKRIIRRTIEIYLRPKQYKNIDNKIRNWKKILFRLVDILKIRPKICLWLILYFFEIINGRMYNQNTNIQGNIDLLICYNNVQKNISLIRNSTIFKLRQLIQNNYKIHYDFVMYNVDMKRQITFQEEQDYSINSMPTKIKGTSIHVIEQKKNSKHPQIQAVHQFHKLIQASEQFYKTIFELQSEELKQQFWKVIAILPVNRSMVNKIENINNFNRKEWDQFIKTKTNQSLQYILNIIYDLMQQNIIWTKQMIKTQGLNMIHNLFIIKIKQNNTCKNIINKLSMVILKALQNDAENINKQNLKQQNIVIIKKLENIFYKENKQQQLILNKQQIISNIDIQYEINNNNNNNNNKNQLNQSNKQNQQYSIDFIYHSLKLLIKSCKILNIKASQFISLQTLLSLIEFSVFQVKNDISTEFIDQLLINNLLTHYSSLQEKKILLDRLMLSKLCTKQLNRIKYCQNYFIFLIDFLNSLTQQDQLILLYDTIYTQKIKQFIINVIQGNYYDQNKLKYNQILFGMLKIISFFIDLNKINMNPQYLFNKLINQLLFTKQIKRIKNDKNKKILYEIIKKMLFQYKNLIIQFTKTIIPQLQKNQWRNNNIINWMLQPDRQQKQLYSGLINLGATCYINCLFQQLYAIKQFRDLFLQVNSQQYRQIQQENQIYQLQKIFISMKYGNKKSYTTKKFCDAFITYQGLCINPTIQNDADQFLNALMEKLQTFLKSKSKHHIIHNTFQGTVTNQFKCEGCPHNSFRQQNFLTIGLNIKNKNTLEQALNGYVEGQVLDGDNAYHCGICQKKVRAVKKISIKQLPNILVIVLKRFQFNFDQMRKIKMNNYLKYPQHLNIAKYVSQNIQGNVQCNYHLRGVVIHSGTSEGGHYYSFIKEDKKWFQFNDQYIIQTDFKRIEDQGFGGDQKTDAQFKIQKHRNAYILFYEKSKEIVQLKMNDEKINKQNNQQNNLNNIDDLHFEKYLQQIIIQDNLNTNFLSIMLDSYFIRLCQNIAMLEQQQAYKFVFLYFHTIIIRDRYRDQYVLNYYRILDRIIQMQNVNKWYLEQINHLYLKQFCIEAPKMVKYLCVSLICTAIKNCSNIPSNLYDHLLFSLSKTGMSPFGEIFKTLVKNNESYNKLLQLKYHQIVLKILINDKQQTGPLITCQSFQSYFGSQCSNKIKQKQLNLNSIIPSIRKFPINLKNVKKLNSQYSSRAINHTIASWFVQKIDQKDIEQELKLMYKITIQCQYRKDQLDKFLFFIRQCCNQNNKQYTIQKIEYSYNILRQFIINSHNYYDPLEYTFNEINKISNNNSEFKLYWIDKIKKDNIFYNIIRNWKNNANYPNMMQKSDQWKRILNNVNDKSQFHQQSRKKIQKLIDWMLKNTTQLNNSILEIDSDLENAQVGKQVTIRGKTVKIKQHLGLITSVDYQRQDKWAILQKNDIELYPML